MIKANDLYNGPEKEKNQSESENAAVPESENKSEETPKLEPTPLKEENVDSQVVTNGAKVYINDPADTEVYVDGKYIGIVPVGFTKKAGSIVITLRKEGHQTRSYTLELEDDNEDVNYSFSELLSIS